ncbi:MAG TPA: methyltransferase type 12, partial [Terriglobales bacterium]|nr:methyltransferase type 12 [Terriglobales bacterium]
LIIEYVSSEDPMFRRLTRGREELHRDFTQAYFEAVCARHFDTVRKQQQTTRALYLLRKKTRP